MPDKLLVPLDGSKLAETALPYAEELAIKIGYEVTLINVRSPAEDPYHPALEAYLKSVAEKTKNNIQTSLVKNKGKGRKVKTVVVGSGILVGNSAEGILEYADNENMDLIVMATHGRTGISLWALGSVAEKVVRASRHPVLLVRANTDLKNKAVLNNILLPLDGSKQSEVALSYVTSFASMLNAKVTLTHVITQPYYSYTATDGIINTDYSAKELKDKKADAKKYLEKAGKTLKRKGIVTSVQVKVGRAAEEIIGLSENTGIDIIVMSTHGDSGFHSSGHGSVADKVLHGGNTPILLVRKRAEGKREPEKTEKEPETIGALIRNLGNDDGMERVKARKSLVTIGKKAVAPVTEAMRNSNKYWERWEAVKTLAQIGDPASAQTLVNALESEEFAVRWIAAEGLIHIGKEAMKPLLNALIERPDSLWLREGAHHVLHDLRDRNLRQSTKPLVAALEENPSLDVSFKAREVLDEIK